MGLLDLLRGQQGAQMPGAMNQPRQSGLSLLLADPGARLAMAGQLMGNQGNGNNFANAMTVGGLAMGKQRELQAQYAGKNQTVEMLKKEAPDIAVAVESGALTPADGYKAYFDRKKGSGADGYKVVDGQIFNTTDQSWITPPGGGGRAETGLVPQMMVNPETNETIYVQPTKDGRLLPSDVPEGFVPYDPFSKAEAVASGKAAGEDRALFDSMSSKMPGLEHVITELDKLADSATYTLGGQALDSGMKQMGMEPRQAAIDRTRYIATVDNQVLPMLRDTFGAAFTVTEGETLRATLGDPNKSPKEKQAVLKAFIEQKRRDVQAMAYRTGQAAPPAQGGTDYNSRYGLEP